MNNEKQKVNYIKSKLKKGDIPKEYRLFSLEASIKIYLKKRIVIDIQTLKICQAVFLHLMRFHTTFFKKPLKSNTACQTTTLYGSA